MADEGKPSAGRGSLGPGRGGQRKVRVPNQTQQSRLRARRLFRRLFPSLHNNGLGLRQAAARLTSIPRGPTTACPTTLLAADTCLLQLPPWTHPQSQQLANVYRITRPTRSSRRHLLPCVCLRLIPRTPPSLSLSALPLLCPKPHRPSLPPPCPASAAGRQMRAQAQQERQQQQQTQQQQTRPSKTSSAQHRRNQNGSGDVGGALDAAGEQQPPR